MQIITFVTDTASIRRIPTRVCFFAKDDYQFCLDHLGEACRKHAVELHAYVLMTMSTFC